MALSDYGSGFRLFHAKGEVGVCSGLAGTTCAEEVTGITVPAKSANLAFAWASRPCPQSDLASLGLASAALLPLRFVVLDGLTDAANVGTIVTLSCNNGTFGQDWPSGLTFHDLQLQEEQARSGNYVYVPHLSGEGC